MLRVTELKNNMLDCQEKKGMSQLRYGGPQCIIDQLTNHQRRLLFYHRIAVSYPLPRTWHQERRETIGCTVVFFLSNAASIRGKQGSPFVSIPTLAEGSGFR